MLKSLTTLTNLNKDLMIMNTAFLQNSISVMSDYIYDSMKIGQWSVPVIRKPNQLKFDDKVTVEILHNLGRHGTNSGTPTLL